MQSAPEADVLVIIKSDQFSKTIKRREKPGCPHTDTGDSNTTHGQSLVNLFPPCSERGYLHTKKNLQNLNRFPPSNRFFMLLLVGLGTEIQFHL